MLFATKFKEKPSKVDGGVAQLVRGGTIKEVMVDPTSHRLVSIKSSKEILFLSFFESNGFFIGQLILAVYPPQYSHF